MKIVASHAGLPPQVSTPRRVETLAPLRTVAPSLAPPAHAPAPPSPRIPPSFEPAPPQAETFVRRVGEQLLRHLNWGRSRAQRRRATRELGRSPLSAYFGARPALDRHFAQVAQNALEGRVTQLPAADRAELRREFRAMERRGATVVRELVQTIGEALGVHELSWPQHVGTGRWAYTLDVPQNDAGVTALFGRYKGVAESLRKTADRLAEHVPTRAERKLARPGAPIEDLFGLTLVVACETFAPAVFERLEGLRASRERSEPGTLKIRDVKDLLAFHGNAKKSGWSALKMVVEWNGFPVELQIRSEASVRIDRRAYVDAAREAPASHEAYRADRARRRAEGLTRDATYAQIRRGLHDIVAP